MNDKFMQVLRDNGLTSEEIKVYLAMFINNHTTILKIAKETKIKRSTVYLIMNSLINKNLARTSIVGKKKFYFVENPNKLLEAMNRKKQAMTDIASLLKEQYKSHKEKPRVTFYEGREGVEKIYEEIGDTRHIQEALWYGSQQDFSEEFNKALRKLEKKLFKIPNYVGSRIILNPIRFDKDYGRKLMADKRYNYPIEVRILPDELFFLNTDCCIYENKMALFSFGKEFFVIVIESADIINAYRMIFDLAWQSAVKL